MKLESDQKDQAIAELVNLVDATTSNSISNAID